MNSDSHSVKEHTGRCVASLPLYNPVIKLGVAWYPLCGEDVRVAIIGEANMTGARRLTLTGPCNGEGTKPLPGARTSVHSRYRLFTRPGETTLCLTFAHRRALARCRLGGIVKGQPYTFLHGHSRKNTTTQRFWSKVNKRGIEECWIWTGSLTNSGYGPIRWQCCPTLAHRMSWEIHYGPIPENMCVLHNCDNRVCVNPKHLFLGTHKDNTQDMIRKNRHGLQRYPGKTHTAKLDWNRVYEIRHLYAEGKITMRQIAELFNVSYTTVNFIVNNRSWKAPLELFPKL